MNARTYPIALGIAWLVAAALMPMPVHGQGRPEGPGPGPKVGTAAVLTPLPAFSRQLPVRALQDRSERDSLQEGERCDGATLPFRSSFSSSRSRLALRVPHSLAAAVMEQIGLSVAPCRHK
jgi:hypothetical protein